MGSKKKVTLTVKKVKKVSALDLKHKELMDEIRSVKLMLLDTKMEELNKPDLPKIPDMSLRLQQEIAELADQIENLRKRNDDLHKFNDRMSLFVMLLIIGTAYMIHLILK